MLVGRLGDVLATLFLCIPSLPDDALLQVKAVKPAAFDVSMVWIGPATGTVRSAVLKAFSSAHAAAEWCANVAKSRAMRPRLDRTRVVKKGDGTGRSRVTSAGRAPGHQGKARRAQGNPAEKIDGKVLRSQASKRTAAPREQKQPDLKKADALEKSGARQPRPATGNQMWHAFKAAAAAARAKKNR
jgi:hypothetical protein